MIGTNDSNDDENNNMKYITIILFLCGIIPAVVSAETVWLDDLNLAPIIQGWGKAQKNKCAAKSSQDGKPLTISAKKFERGVGTVAESALNIHLNGEATKFSAHVGVDDCKRDSSRASVEFFVIGDGKQLWRSGVMHATMRKRLLKLASPE